MDALRQWTLRDLVDRVLREHLVDECVLEDEYVIIVQGSTRFVLDHQRAHAFLRGVVRGMSPAFRRRSRTGKSSRPIGRSGGDQGDEEGGLFDAVRKHLVKKWWGQYKEAGCPFGRSVSGLLLWIRYDTRVTAS